MRSTGFGLLKRILYDNNQMKIVFEKIRKEKNKQSMEEYKREEKEYVQYQNNLIDKTFDSMLHLTVHLFYNFFLNGYSFG